MGGPGLAADEHRHQPQPQQQEPPVGGAQRVGQLAGGLALKDGAGRPAQQHGHDGQPDEIFLVFHGNDLPAAPGAGRVCVYIMPGTVQAYMGWAPRSTSRSTTRLTA